MVAPRPEVYLVIVSKDVVLGPSTALLVGAPAAPGLRERKGGIWMACRGQGQQPSQPDYGQTPPPQGLLDHLWSDTSGPEQPDSHLRPRPSANQA